MKLSRMILALVWASIFCHSTLAMQSVAPNPKESAGRQGATPGAAKMEALEELKEAEASYRSSLELRNQFAEKSHESVAEAKLRESIRRMEDEIGGEPLIAETSILSLLTARRVELIIDIAGLTAKLEHALKSRAERQAHRSENDDAMIRQQRQILTLTQKKHERILLLHSKGTNSEAEVAESEREVARAELQLLEKMKELEQPLQADPQAEIGLLLAEKKSQLETVEELLKQAASLRRSAAELAEMKARLKQIRNAREYGTMEILKEVEKGLTMRQFNQLESRQRIEKLEAEEQDNDDDKQ